ncbi:MAG: AAA family ATPase, partial [Oscillibacter sp.]|nr:AAA family ATPase [Oscillibacter sp.]
MDEMKLTIKGLFGHFDYEIPLYGLSDADSFPVSDGVTILTGANGYGKTTILRMLEAFGMGNLDFFVDLKFQSFSFYQEDSKDRITLEKTRDGFVLSHGANT